MTRTEQGMELYGLGLRLGGMGAVAIGGTGGSLAAALARSAGCGVALGGGRACFHDGSCAACGVWLAEYYRLSAALFISQRGEHVHIRLTDGQGRPFSPPAREGQAPCTGVWDRFRGTEAGWAARRVRSGGARQTVAAEGPEGLRLLLERMGCDVSDRPRRGIPLLRSDREGFALSLVEDGGCVPLPGADALDAAARWLTGERAAAAFGFVE